jgi:hypothetical protein
MAITTPIKPLVDNSVIPRPNTESDIEGSFNFDRESMDKLVDQVVLMGDIFHIDLPKGAGLVVRTNG